MCLTVPFKREWKKYKIFNFLLIMITFLTFFELSYQLSPRMGYCWCCNTHIKEMNNIQLTIISTQLLTYPKRKDFLQFMYFSNILTVLYLLHLFHFVSSHYTTDVSSMLSFEGIQKPLLCFFVQKDACAHNFW